MDVFLMIRRKKLTIFTDAKDTTTVLELKKMIEGILKVPPPSQMLFNKDSQLMEDEKTLAEYGLTSATAKAQCPAPIGLALRKESGEFEALDLTPYSSPPDLPDVMKSQEANGQEQGSEAGALSRMSPASVWERTGPAFVPEQKPASPSRRAPPSPGRRAELACAAHHTLFRFKRAVWRWVL